MNTPPAIPYEVDHRVHPLHFDIFHQEFIQRDSKKHAPNSNFLKGVKWTPEGECFCTATDDFRLHIYRLNRKDTLQQFSNDQGIQQHNARATEEYADGKVLKTPDVSPNDPYPPIQQIHAGELIYDYAWYPSCSTTQDLSTCCVAMTARGHPVHLYDALGNLRSTYRPYNALDELSPAYSIAFDPDGLKMFAGGRSSISIFDVERPGRDCDTITTYDKNIETGGGQPGIISCITFSTFTKDLYGAGSYSGYAAIYDYRTNEQLAVLEGHPGGVTHLKFSACGNYLYSGGRRDGHIYCWDARHLSGALYNIQRPTESTNQRMYFDIEPCGRNLVSGGGDGFVRFYDLRDGSECGRFRAAADTVNGVEFHPLEPILATASGHRRFGFVADGTDDGCSDSDVESEGEEGDEMRVCRLQRDENCLILWALASLKEDEAVDGGEHEAINAAI